MHLPPRRRPARPSSRSAIARLGAAHLSLGLALALAAPAAPAAAAAADLAAGRPHVDPDAIREVRRMAADHPAAGRAIAAYLEARRRLGDGEVGAAADALRVAVTFDPASAELHVALAEALSLCGRLELAEGEARHALELEPDGPDGSAAHVLLAQLARARRDPGSAILELRHAIRIELALAADSGAAPDPAPWRVLAATYLDAGDEPAAWRTLEDLAARGPGAADGFREGGRRLLDRRELPRAERHLRRAAELAPRDAEVLRLLARAHEAMGRAPDVRADLERLLALEPEDAPALLALARAELAAGEVQRARDGFGRYLRAARARGPDAAVEVSGTWREAGRAADALEAARDGALEHGRTGALALAEGLALADLRRWAEAAQALGLVSPHDEAAFVPARLALAAALSRLGRHAEAERALAEPLRAAPGDARLAGARAEVLERAGRAAEAAEVLDRAAAERDQDGDGDGAAALFARQGEVWVRAGRAPAALAALDRALAAHPRAAPILFARAAALAAAGRGEEGIAALRALVALEPGHAAGLAALALALAERPERLGEAEEVARRAVAVAPRQAAPQAALGRVLLARGEAAAAIPALEGALATAPGDAEVLAALGDAFRAAGREADAAGAWRRAQAALAEDGRPAAGAALRLKGELDRRLRPTAPAVRPASREVEPHPPRSP